MVLVDTSIWINHFRRSIRALGVQLENSLVLCHPYIVGELACGTLRRREETLQWLQLLPRAPVAEDDEVLEMIDTLELWGTGLGWVDVHLVAAARLASVRLWTADRRLVGVCRDLGIVYAP